MADYRHIARGSDGMKMGQNAAAMTLRASAEPLSGNNTTRTVGRSGFVSGLQCDSDVAADAAPVEGAE